MVWYKSVDCVCSTSDHMETVHFYHDSHSSDWTLSSIFTIAYFNENQESKITHTVRKMACKYRWQPALRTPHFCPPRLPAHLLQFQAYRLSQPPAEPMSSGPRRHTWHSCPPPTQPYSTFQPILHRLPVLPWNLSCRVQLKLDAAEKGKLKIAGYAAFWK